MEDRRGSEPDAGLAGSAACKYAAAFAALHRAAGAGAEAAADPFIADAKSERAWRRGLAGVTSTDGQSGTMMMAALRSDTLLPWRQVIMPLRCLSPSAPA